MQCNDISLNSGPRLKITCPRYLKTIRKNQGCMTCNSCQSTYLKCLDDNFKNEHLCHLCYIQHSGISNNNTTLGDDESQQLQELLNLQNNRGLKIAHLNIRSLRGKIDEVRVIISKCSDLHILAVNEILLDKELLDDEVKIPGFNICRADRRKGGGVAIFVRENLTVAQFGAKRDSGAK